METLKQVTNFGAKKWALMETTGVYNPMELLWYQDGLESTLLPNKNGIEIFFAHTVIHS